MYFFITGGLVVDCCCSVSCHLRCPCCSGADEHGWGYISHTAPAGPCYPSHIHLQPAFFSLLTYCLIQRAIQCEWCVPSAPQCLLQWHSWSSTPLLQQGMCLYKGSLQPITQSGIRFLPIVIYTVCNNLVY